MLTRTIRISLLAAVLAPTLASADPAEDDAPPPREPTAVTVRTAPVSGEESGRIDSGDHGDGTDTTGRLLARGVLFVPKLAVTVVFAPLRGLIYVYERYQLSQRYFGLFFDDTRTYGIVPVAEIEAGFGLSGGGKTLHRNVFGGNEHFSARAVFGGQFQQAASVKLDTGTRFGDRFKLELEGVYEKHPRDKFFGIGNTDIVDPEMHVVGETNVKARYRNRVERVMGIADLGVAGPLHLMASGSLVDFTYASIEDAPIDELYPMNQIVGFATGDRHSYNELEVRWDRRQRGSDWEVDAVPSTGELISVFGGRVTALDDGPDYWRAGADLQKPIRLGRGPRVLTARVYAEAVSGSRDEVPFTALPRLGGKMLLRGYDLDRFRDRFASMGSLEYSWDLTKEFSASVFADAGRVASSVRDWNDGPLRVGYGFGLEAHTDKSFLLRSSIATSVDGGLFLNIAFEPVTELGARVERR
ncbi:MAG: BamA/TamA family outer membrane protein [Kofleriaceae bacterium]